MRNKILTIQHHYYSNHEKLLIHLVILSLIFTQFNFCLVNTIKIKTITTAAATFAVSATNASLNADNLGNIDDVARFKEKGMEFETAVPGANTIGMANVIPTDPNDPEYDLNRLYLIGQPLSADPKGYKPNAAQEGGWVSRVANPINGMNSMSVFHDKFTQETFLGAPGLLQLSIIPAIPINYYGLIGKELRNLYEQPANNLTGDIK